MGKRDKSLTRMGKVSEGVRLPELITHLDRFIITSEKKCVHESLKKFDEELKGEVKADISSERIVANFADRLCNQTLTNDELRTVLKLYQYHLHEIHVLDDLSTNDACEDIEINNGSRSKDVRLPKIAKRHLPLRPTTLLDRVIDKHKMKEEIIIPTMVLKDSSSSQNSHRTVETSAQSREKGHREKHSRKEKLPHFNYEHGEGMGARRNLPGQPELIRMLTDPELSLSGNNGDKKSLPVTEFNRSNSLLSLYGGTLSPPLLDKQKQRRPRKRKIVCKFCRRSPGDHQKWCIYYNFGSITEEAPVELSRSHTQNEIDVSKNIKSKENLQDQERSKTSMDDYMRRPELPDFKPLHRDVYIRALADSRARLIFHRSHDFVNQLTKPFVFSYFSRLNGPKCKRDGIHGMTRIFGKDKTDFTEYYKLFADEIRQGNA
ncbi:uncharacterized protein LOC132718160 [Ruditapes philippinarum]|uniref:uncharacterized protein LOC132718160 n=1 Tax=Ruditapes philippinarum TaxID=129788 RepID=UPI00295AC7A2|nr:uncharacterized protein LOC132718160 [Ruditapes philippinarum]